MCPPEEAVIERFQGPRELIVVLAEEGLKGAALKPHLSPFHATIQPLFNLPKKPSAPWAAAARLRRFFGVDAPETQLAAIAEILREQPEVATAYVKPGAGVPAWAAAAVIAAPFKEPVIEQPYLEGAPTGVGARAAWEVPGGDGTGVTIADIELDWILDHEDLPLSVHNLLGPKHGGGANHGAAVVGIMGGIPNGYGITGVAHGASFQLASTFQASTTSSVISKVAGGLHAGDVLLIVLERPGPRLDEKENAKFIPLEWWEDDLLAIRQAVDDGVIVVAAAGNSGVSLDDPRYQVPYSHFSKDWRNPFARELDSGAILVGAGAPPPGVHGQDWGPDRSRLEESNYGRAIDAQGWGREVTTAGYGDLQRGNDPRQWYKKGFRATSAAAPMVAAAIACMQGARKAANKKVLNGFQVRAALRDPAMNSPQQDGHFGSAKTHRIGGRPNLEMLLKLP